MAKFSVGDTVINVNSSEKGIVQEVFPPARGKQLYKVVINNNSLNCLESNLIPDTDLTDPFERIRRGIFGTFLDFARINTSFKIQNTSNNTISSLKASNTIFKAYQFKPLLKFLNSDNRRLLVADEVGLGKTIEAGHIMLELMARRELRNAVIICPKALQLKWQTELKEKFNLQFKIYDSARDFITDIKDHGAIIKAIINYEKVRLPKENQKKNKTNKRGLFDIINEDGFKLDFVLCDEAHRLRNHTTQTHKGVKELLDFASSAVFLTATPIMISEHNLFNLLQLLDQHKYSDYSTFHNEIAVNAPFIRALQQINNNAPLKTIANDLKDSRVSLFYTSGDEYKVEWSSVETVDKLFNDIPLYLNIMNRLMTAEDSHETRVQLQFDITDISEMNKIFSRTRKREVTQDWSQAVREPHTEIIELYEDERREFDAVIEEYIDDNTFIDEYGEEKMAAGRILGLIQRKRQVASSVYGFLNNKEDLVAGVDRYRLKKDAKYEKLVEIIQEVVIKEKKKLIVFALFVDTLQYLRIRLSLDGIGTAIIHGKVNERGSEIDKFKNDSSTHVLLSSEVGSEGLDMQFCDALVNYDLPWNPMVVEQRIGRIDRFGQKSPIVNIYNLIVKDSIQEDIYTRLLDRIGIFRGCIGDLEAILDKDLDRQRGLGVRNIREWFGSLEKELYCKQISPTQRKERIDQIERAIITEKRNLDDISEGLTDTLTNDAYFKNEIENIQNYNRYVTEIELINYVRILIQMKLTTCSLIEKDEENLIYHLEIPQSSPRLLVNFLNQYQSNDPDSILAYRNFINSIREKTILEVTFSQEAGYENSKIIRIHPYHPLIMAAMNYFEESKKETNNTFQFSIDKGKIGRIPLDYGEYILAIYISISIKKMHNREQRTEHLVPILYDIQNEIVTSNPSISHGLFGAAQLWAQPKTTQTYIDDNTIRDLEYILAEEIENFEAVNRNEQRMRLETHKKLQVQRRLEFYQNRIQQQERIVQSSEAKVATTMDPSERKNILSILPAQRKILSNLVEQRDKVLEEINTTDILFKTPILLSLNQISIV